MYWGTSRWSPTEIMVSDTGNKWLILGSQEYTEQADNCYTMYNKHLDVVLRNFTEIESTR